MKTLYTTVLEALFPTPAAEAAVLSMDPESVWQRLPRAKQFPVVEACSIFSYKNELVWRLIWSLKYKKSAAAAHIAAHAMKRTLETYSSALGFPIWIIPMPVSKRRMRERGYNQCDLLAEALQTNSIQVYRDILVRAHHKSRQTLKDRKDRLESAHDIFAVNNLQAQELLSKIRAQETYLLIVIDDVITTGSTIRDAIHTLRNAGFENTFGLSVAH